VVVVLDATTWPALDPTTEQALGGDVLVLVNKIDLRPISEPVTVHGKPAHMLSLATGEGFLEARQAMAGKVRELADSGGAPVLTRARHRAALESAVDALARAGRAGAAELAAEDMRLAARALGRITGRIDVEDILDVVFREFCIGK
jgi:tRNA modification GTPase